MAREDENRLGAQEGCKRELRTARQTIVMTKWTLELDHPSLEIR